MRRAIEIPCLPEKIVKELLFIPGKQKRLDLPGQDVFPHVVIYLSFRSVSKTALARKLKLNPDARIEVGLIGLIGHKAVMMMFHVLVIYILT
jgi:hypothetical protein